MNWWTCSSILWAHLFGLLDARPTSNGEFFEEKVCHSMTMPFATVRLILERLQMHSASCLPGIGANVELCCFLSRLPSGSCPFRALIPSSDAADDRSLFAECKTLYHDITSLLGALRERHRITQWQNCLFALIINRIRPTGLLLLSHFHIQFRWFFKDY